MTYDLGESRRARPPLLPVVVLLVVIGGAAGLVGAWASAATPSATQSVPSAVASPSASVGPTAFDEPERHSSAEDGAGIPPGGQEAAERFVAVWLDPSPETRLPALREVAVPALADELALTDPENVPDATPKGRPEIADVSTYALLFRQELSTGMVIEVALVADPDSPEGWVATSVDRV